MSKLKIVVVSGNLGAPSKTLTLAAQIVAAVTAHIDTEEKIYQLADLAATFGVARNPGELDDAGKSVIQNIESADILIAVTPVYKGSYTGLFKHLFDFIHPLALSEVPVIIGATGGGEKHALILEHQLRPLFGFFGASTVPVGIYATEKNFENGVITDEIVQERIIAAARQAVALVQKRTLAHIN
ncbi:FMN reductase [Candidatus Methylospira mobilis]|uniref:FMN reductase n=1 Tax=Candidatus Methylospira mobilis TaxID=1808979 RepID=A0A5Q0BM74_9GAMM|nr:FMN reductase [Candidatus Methylospira mobilis]QFY43207.1 FMN reductase [Candidatus Methylospira mobilis]WNV03588.1 FMN reductase [Candidatus Methylospira mobilis]